MITFSVSVRRTSLEAGLLAGSSRPSAIELTTFNH